MKNFWLVYLSLLIFIIGSVILCDLCFSQDKEIIVSAQNRLEISRPVETISVKWADVKNKLGTVKPGQVQVKDKKTGKVLESQAVDNDSDGTFDELIFQSGFGSGEEKKFLIFKGSVKKESDPKKPRAYAVFVPVRYDDFAWENDRIAFRMYGPELQKMKASGKKGGLISSGIDCWQKRVRYPIVDSWYKGGDYHKDRGEGLDAYKVDTSRGCGGTGIWENNRLYNSENYKKWKIIANGPIRIIFELTFEPWDVNGKKISEVKRITLDKGDNLNRFDSLFEIKGKSKEITYAIGIAKHKKRGKPKYNKKDGWLRYWEKSGKGRSMLGLGIVVNPDNIIEMKDLNVGKKNGSHHLVIAKAKTGEPATYYSGFGWARSKDFTDAASWDAYLENFAKCLASPVKVSTK